MSASFFLMHGLHVRSNGKAWTRERTLRAVERGDLLLVMQTPFRPLSKAPSGTYSHITGKGRRGGLHRRQVSEPLPLPTSPPSSSPHP